MATAGELMLRDLEARYAEVDVSEAYMRLYPAPGAMGRMCAHFQERLNRHFDFMNYKLRGNRHFNAEDSRQLIALIDEVREAQQLLRHLGTEITITEYYAQVLESCSQFLKESYGSPIPEGFNRIQLAKYEPVFLLPEAHLSSVTRQKTYELQLIGEGSFGLVFRYDDPDYGPFALKRAKRDLDERDLMRFRREFELLKELRFPYVLEVYRYSDGRNEYTMEYCDANLGDYIAKRNATLSFGTRKRIALQFLYGLNYLHSKGHLHRDVSIGNVLLKVYDGAAVLVKLSDFGLIKARDSEFTRTESELRGTILDPTLRSFREYNVLNEVYSVGFVLSFVFSGRRSIAACTGAVRAIIDKCVIHDHDARYSNVLSVIRDVESLEPEAKSGPSETPA